MVGRLKLYLIKTLSIDLSLGEPVRSTLPMFETVRRYLPLLHEFEGVYLVTEAEEMLATEDGELLIV